MLPAAIGNFAPFRLNPPLPPAPLPPPNVIFEPEIPEYPLPPASPVYYRISPDTVLKEVIL
jgi:hypothetical protein